MTTMSNVHVYQVYVVVQHVWDCQHQLDDQYRYPNDNTEIVYLVNWVFNYEGPSIQ